MIILKLLKAAVVFLGLLIICYILCEIVFFGIIYFFFNESQPTLEVLLIVNGLLIPAVSVSLAVLGTVKLMKKKKFIHVNEGDPTDVNK